MHPFWQGFLLLFGLGLVIVIAVTLLTPPEPIETLRAFHNKCRPPGFWGPVTKDLDAVERKLIADETTRDLVDCGLGILFAASAVVSVISPLAANWAVFAGALALTAFSGISFIRRWMARGVFRGMQGT